MKVRIITNGKKQIVDLGHDGLVRFNGDINCFHIVSYEGVYSNKGNVKFDLEVYIPCDMKVDLESTAIKLCDSCGK